MRNNKLIRIICFILSILLFVEPVIIYAGSKPIVFRKENGDTFFAITPEGDIISSIPIESDQNSFTILNGDIRIFKNSDPLNNIIGVTENEIKIRKSLCEFSDADPGQNSLRFNSTVDEQNIESFIQEEGDCDLSIRGKTYFSHNVDKQPSYHRIFTYQTENDQSPIVKTTYFDGLGRGVQTQHQKSSILTQISGVYYDEVGRVDKSTKKSTLATLNQFYPMYENGDEKLLNTINNHYPEAENKAYREKYYYSEPLGRIKSVGEYGKDYSLDGNHKKLWYFGITGSNKYANDEFKLSNWFNSDGFILSSRLNDPLVLDLLRHLEDTLYAVYLEKPDTIDYALTLLKDSDDNFIQIIEDKFGRTIRRWIDADDDNSKGEIISYTKYDIQDNILEMNPPKDRDNGPDPIKLIDSIICTYNSLGQLIEKISPDEKITFCEYDNAGNLINLTKAKGTVDELVISYIYDRINRIIRIKADNSEQIRNYYDNIDSLYEIDQYLLSNDDRTIRGIISNELENLRGNLVANISVGYDPEISSTIPDENRCVIDLYSYDEENRIKANYKYIPGVSWQKTTYAYNLMGNATTKTIYPRYKQTGAPSELTLFYRYDILGRVHCLTKEDLADTVYTVSYDDVGRIGKKTIYNNDGETRLKEIIYDYTIHDRIKKIDASPHFTEEIDYTGNFTGNISNVKFDYNVNNTKHSWDLTYTYDNLYRLTNVEDANPNELYSEAFSYDQIGRIVQKNEHSSTLVGFKPKYEYENNTNKLSKITHLPVSQYTYDNRGNLLSDKSKKINNVCYDWRDLPIKFKLKEGSEPWSVDINMVYDGSGNRVIKREKIIENQSITKSKAVAYVNDDMVYENSNYGTDEYEFKYFYLEKEGRLNATLNTKNYNLKGHLGSTRYALSDDGSWLEATMYDSFGKMWQFAPSGQTDPIRRKFTSKEYDEEGWVSGETNGMGLYYFGARYYDPEIGLWISPDKAFDSFNSYLYGNANPIIYIDEDGNIPILAVIAIGALLGGAISATKAWNKPNADAGDVAKAFLEGAGIGAIGTVVSVAVTGGLIAAAGGAGLLSAVSQMTGRAAYTIAATSGATGGAAGSATSAFLEGYMESGSVSEAFSKVPNAAAWGLGLGAIGTTTGAVVSRHAPGMFGKYCMEGANILPPLAKDIGGITSSLGGSNSTVPYGPTSEPEGDGEDGVSTVPTTGEVESAENEIEIQSTDPVPVEVTYEVTVDDAKEKTPESESEGDGKVTTDSPYFVQNEGNVNKTVWYKKKQPKPKIKPKIKPKPKPKTNQPSNKSK